MKTKNYLAILAFIVPFFLFTSCGGDDAIDDDDDNTSGSIDEEIDDEFETNPNDDVDIDEENTVRIFFNEASVTITNPYEGKGIKITHEGADVVVTSTVSNEICYLLSGVTDEGSLKIYSDTKFELLMNGVSIVNSDDPALNIQSGKKATITLVEGTSNRLGGGTMFVSEGGEEDMKAAFFSEGQLVFTGTGKLVVMGRYRHAICSDDYILIESGNIKVSMAAKDGVHANDYIEMKGGTVDINAIGDGFDSEGSITISGGSLTTTTTGEKGNGVKCEGDLKINGGVIVVRTSGVEAEGMESMSNLVINNGSIDVEAYDDCINAAKSITINGGSTYCYSKSNDGIDSNGTITITGGTVVAVGAPMPEEGIDCDRNTFKITGGTVLGIGGTTSSPTSNVCTQHALVYSGRGFSQNSVFNISSSAGKNVLTYTIPCSYNEITVLFSSPEMKNGTSYTISSGGSVSGGTSFHGLYNGATYSGGSNLSTFTVSSMVTTLGEGGHKP